jgi:hypothetical protein
MLLLSISASIALGRLRGRSFRLLIDKDVFDLDIPRSRPSWSVDNLARSKTTMLWTINQVNESIVIVSEINR